METLKVYIYGFILLTLVGGIGAIVLQSFRATEVTGVAACNATDTTGCSLTYNISTDGLSGISNTTSQFGTAGTILGVALLLGIVFSAFYMLQNRA